MENFKKLPGSPTGRWSREKSFSDAIEYQVDKVWKQHAPIQADLTSIEDMLMGTEKGAMNVFTIYKASHKRH